MTLFLIPLPDQTQLDTLRKGSEEDGFQWKSILTTLKIQDYDSKSPSKSSGANGASSSSGSTQVVT